MNKLVMSIAPVVVLTACMTSTAVITDLDEDKVLVQARHPDPSQVAAEANRGCAIHGRTAVQINKRCLESNCETQSFQFACTGASSYSGNPSSPWLGMSVDDVADHLYADPPGSPEVVITRIVADGPADKAGLRVGDMVESFNGFRVQNSTTLIELKRGVTAGARIPLRVRRGSKELGFVLTV